MSDQPILVVPVDFSPQCDEAVAYAVDLAVQLGGAVHLVNVCPLALPYSNQGLHTMPDLLDPIRENARSALSALRERFEDRGVKLEQHYVEGVPHEQIIRLVNELGATMVVMATHGRTGVKHALLGSVAERVVRTCPSPVLTHRS